MEKVARVAAVLVVAGAFVYVLLTHTMLGLLLLPLSQNAGNFDRERLSAVVDRVRKSGIKPGGHREFLLSSSMDAASLRAANTRDHVIGEGVGRVWAEVASSGALMVVIETRDLGHAGEYGFAYSDAEPKPVANGEGFWKLDVPGPLNQVNPKSKIDAHWWAVENLMD